MDRIGSQNAGAVSDETTREWVARARALKPTLEAAAAEMEETQTIPEPVLDALHEAEIFRIILPRSVGGAELNPKTHALVVGAISEGDASVGWCIAQSACASMSSAYMTPHVAQEIFSGPRSVFTFGFALRNPPCLAIPVDGGWKVTGTWTFGSASRIAQWLGGHCRVCDENGEPLEGPDGAIVERTMLFPRSAARIHEGSWEVMGLCGTGSDTYSVEDLFVPADYTVIPRATAREHNKPEDAILEPEPERREAGTLYRHSMQLIATCGLSSVALGAAQAMLDAFIPLARSKTPSNAIALKDDTHVQGLIAQAHARISSARAWMVELLDRAWEECETEGLVSFPTRIKLRQAGTHQIESAREAANMVFLAAGATAIFKSNPFERRFRDIHVVSIQVQGSIARMQSAGQYYLGLTPAQLTLVP